jgi:peptidyl-prolyl cis-trans isomerase SurA
MDAVSPLCRWLSVIGLFALVGCKSADTAAAVNARGQAPVELPGPISPALSGQLPPTQPLPQVGLPPVQGIPISISPISPASFTTTAPEPSKSADPVGKFNISRESVGPNGGVPQIKVVAIVGVKASIITDQEVMEAVRQHITEYRNLEDAERTKKEKELYRSELGNIIARELILDELAGLLKKQNKSIDDIKEIASQDTEQNLRSIQKQQGARTEQEFIEQLRAQGLTLPGLRRSMEREMMANMYIYGLLKDTGRNPGFAEIRRYYDLHPEEFQIKDRVRYLDLCVRTGNFNSLEQARGHADEVRQMALNGTDFVSLIKVEEKSPQGRVNWDGIGTTREDVPLDLAPAVFALTPGQISDIVSTPTGFHIVKVLEREYAGARPLDDKVQNECRTKLKRIYREEDKKKMIEELWRKATVQVFEID